MGVTIGKPVQPAQASDGRIILQINPQQSQQSSGTAKQGSVPSNTVLESQVEAIIQNVLTINLFFDGTKNNMYNIDNQAKYSRQIKKDPKAYESYTNAYSNVVHLFKATESNRRRDIINIYIEGMGSAKDQKDDQDGFALGSGQTGITNRAEKAVEEIMNLTKPYKQAGLQLIKINVFGFSRGAATARHFLSKLKGKQDLSAWKIPTKFRVHFVGLFDTVSSFDPRPMSEVSWDSATRPLGRAKDFIVDTLTDAYSRRFNFNTDNTDNTVNKKHLPEFNNDVNELDLTLDAGERTHPLKVFHICAADEYRAFFSLTDIDSARLGRGAGTGFGYEIILPGAHSDIGGSYPDGIDEEYHCTGNDDILAKWLMAQGFYTPEQRKIIAPSYDELESTMFYRKKIPFDAFKIALKVMYEMAVQQGGMGYVFNKKYIKKVCDSRYPVITGLVENVPTQVLNELQGIGSKQGAGWTGNLTAFNFAYLYPNLPAFRNQFVHWSAKKEIGYEVRRSTATESTAFGDFQQMAADKGLKTAVIVGADALLFLEPRRRIHHG